MKYYLYRHIRLDKNEPFYIGIGTKPKKFISFAVEFSRACNKSRRNLIWKKIANKTEHIVEIMLESDDLEFIKKKEQEFIKFYGRIDLKTGTLANMTDGGDGAVNHSLSKETKRKIGINNHFKEKFGKNNPKSKKVYQYDIKGNFIKKWDSLADVGRHFNLPNKRIPTFKGKTFKGFIWKYDFLGDKIEEVDYNKGLKNRIDKVKVSVYQYDLNKNFICKYSSYTEANKITGISINGIQIATNRKNNICRGYIWSKEPLNFNK
jgi:hypothetical protein